VPSHDKERRLVLLLLVAAVARCHLHGAGGARADESRPLVDPEVQRSTHRRRARVLIERRVPPQPSSEDVPQGSPADFTLGSAIAVAQRAALSRLPASHFFLLRWFDAVPLSAREIDAEALRVLENTGVVPYRQLAPTDP
jgi:hypothetical protein